MEEAPTIVLETYQSDEEETEGICLLEGLVELDTGSIPLEELEMPQGPPPTLETQEEIEHREDCNGLICNC